MNLFLRRSNKLETGAQTGIYGANNEWLHVFLLITFPNSSLEFGDHFAQFEPIALTNRFVLKTIFD